MQLTLLTVVFLRKTVAWSTFLLNWISYRIIWPFRCFRSGRVHIKHTTSGVWKKLVKLVGGPEGGPSGVSRYEKASWPKPIWFWPDTRNSYSTPRSEQIFENIKVTWLTQVATMNSDLKGYFQVHSQLILLMMYYSIQVSPMKIKTINSLG